MKVKTKKTEFNTLMEYAREMHRRYFHAISAFYAFEALKEVRAPNIVGPAYAEKNANIMSRYNGVFMLTEEALRVYFFLELAKMFDSSREALHVNKIVNFTSSNLKKLTVEAFKDYNEHQSRAFIQNLVNEYQGMSHKELIEIRKELNNHKTTLNKLNVYRDKWLAHDDIKKPKLPSITGKEVKALFEVLAKILNSITGRLNSESWAYSHVESDTKNSTRLIVEHLRRFEPYLQKEIKEKYHQP